MIIQTENLTKRFGYYSKVDAVDGVNLRVPEGAAFALVGPNGAGKTTLLRMLVNVVLPDAGAARILDKDARRLGIRDWQQIGYISENQILPEALSVTQYFAYLRTIYPAWDIALEKELRQRLELPAGRALGKLSHGMRIKTMLAGALAFRPKLLILDEPLSGLDPSMRDEVVEGVLSQAGETTVVISSHEIAEIESFTTHLAFMAHGRIAFQEALEDVRARFRDVTVTLGTDVSARTSLPGTWLSPRQEGCTMRFIDTAFANEDALRATLAAQVGPVRRVEATPISLRDISKALIRATRKESHA